MTPQQQAALEALAGRALTQAEVEQITPLVASWSIGPIAAILSAGRTAVVSRMTSARGLAEFMPGGPLAAETVLLKLESARDSMIVSSDAQQRVLGSLLRRQLGFLAGEGLDFGSAPLRLMLDQFAALGVLTTQEVSGLKSIATRPAPLTDTQVETALRGAA